MSLSDVASIGGVLGSVAVLASVLLLYFQLRQLAEQIRQSERNQQALIRQGMTERIVSILLTGTEPSLATVLSKFGGVGFDAARAAQATDISPTEHAQFQQYLSALFASFVDIFYQHKEGLVTDSAYAIPVLGVTQMMNSAAVRQHWADARTIYPDEFVAFVDGLADQPSAGGRPAGPFAPRSA